MPGTFARQPMPTRAAVTGQDEKVRAANIDAEKLVRGADLLVDINIKTFFQFTLQLALMPVVKDSPKPRPFARVDHHRAFARRTGEQQGEEEEHACPRTKRTQPL